MLSMQLMAISLTDSANAPREDAVACLPRGEERCREYLSFQPIQFLSARRLRIVEPIFCFCPHSILTPWLPSLTLACHDDPEGADVLLDSVLVWWREYLELFGDTHPPMMHIFCRRFLQSLSLKGLLNPDEEKILHLSARKDLFWLESLDE